MNNQTLKGLSLITQHNILRNELFSYQYSQYKKWCNITNVNINTNSVVRLKMDSHILKVMQTKLNYQSENDIYELNRMLNQNVNQIEILPNLFIPDRHILPYYRPLEIDNECIYKILSLNKYDLFMDIWSKVNGNKLPDFNYMLCYSCLSGNIDLVRSIIDLFSNNINSDDIATLYPIRVDTEYFGYFEFTLLDFCYGSGNLDLVQYIEHEYNLTPNHKSILHTLGLCGHLNIIEQFHEQESEEFDRTIMDCASGNGCLHVVEWLHNNRSEGCTKRAMDHAAKNGHLNIIEFLHTYRDEGCTKRAMNLASKYNHLNIVEWLHNNRNEGCSTRAMDIASEKNHLNIVKFLHNQRSEGCTTWAMDIASGNGHLKIVEWLHNNRNEGCTSNAMDYASRSGNLNITEFLHHQRNEGCTSWAMDYAAGNGHLKIVEFLHWNRDERCTISAIEWASKFGHLDVVEFLYRNIFSKSEQSLVIAKENANDHNFQDIVEFLNKYI